MGKRLLGLPAIVAVLLCAAPLRAAQPALHRIGIGGARVVEIDVDSGGVVIAGDPHADGVTVSTEVRGTAPSALPATWTHVGERLVVTVGRSAGASQLPFVSSGSVAYRVGYPSGRKLIVRAFAGDVEIDNPNAAVQVTQGRGQVRVVNPQAQVKVDDNSGSVEVTGARSGVDVAAQIGAVQVTLASNWHPRPIRMESGNGDVALTVPLHFRARLDASSGQGSVSNALSASAGRAHGPPVWLYTARGNVTIATLPPS